ncbi:hypothetical protein [Mucisphaera sp.]|uniref:hypothetical protein n=1 Tax=Mucisphaera sp. TaxID=2913024 RepID=UPI003D0DFC8E
MIVYACADLIFATKIRGTADALGIVSRPTRDIDKLRARLERVDDGKPNDAVTALLIDLDLGEDAIDLIRFAVAHPARPAILAFGAHVAVDLLNQAAEAGASPVMARGAFTAQLPMILQQLDQPSTT